MCCLSKIQSLQTFLQSIEISQYELSWEVRYFRRSELQRNIRKVLFRGKTCAQNWSETNQSNLATKKPSHLSELQKILWTFYWRGDLCLELGGEEVNQLLVLDAGLHKLLPANNWIRPQLFLSALTWSLFHLSWCPSWWRCLGLSPPGSAAPPRMPSPRYTLPRVARSPPGRDPSSSRSTSQSSSSQPGRSNHSRLGRTYWGQADHYSSKSYKNVDNLFLPHGFTFSWTKHCLWYLCQIFEGCISSTLASRCGKF